MVGVPGIAMRLFGALAREGISVILISQASSEHSICFAVEPAAVGAAAAGIGREFALERAAGLIDELVVERDLAVIAAVGSAMRERPGIAGRLFGVLGDHGINVRAVAQGSSERNISLVVARPTRRGRCERIHEAFFFPERRTVEIALAGVGRVGGELLAQIAARREALERERGLRLVVTAVAGEAVDASPTPAGLDPATAAERLRAAPAPGGVAALIDDLIAERRAAAGLRRLHGERRGRRRATSACWPPGWRWSPPTSCAWPGRSPAGGRCAAAGPGRCYFETTVGAGLPVIAPLERLRETGDVRAADRRRAVGDAGLSDRSPRRRRAAVGGGRAEPTSWATPSPTRARTWAAATSPARSSSSPGSPASTSSPATSRSSRCCRSTTPAGRALDLARVLAPSAGGRRRAGAPRAPKRRGPGGASATSPRFAGGRARVGLEAVGPDHPLLRRRRHRQPDRHPQRALPRLAAGGARARRRPGGDRRRRVRRHPAGGRRMAARVSKAIG